MSPKETAPPGPAGDQDDLAGGEAEARRLAVEELEQNLFIEAGAGTGKTTLLVERLIETVRRGRARLTEVAAITFTEKAAGELVHRVRARLEEALAAETDPQARPRLEEALEDVERAAISTIHGLAGQLLRERPVEAGIDPRFTPLDPAAEELALEEAWEAWLPAALERDPAPVRRALLIGVALRKMKELAFFLFRNRDREGWAAGGEEPEADLEGFLERWSAIDRKLEGLAPLCKLPEDGALIQIAPLRERLARARDLLRQRKPERLEPFILDLKVNARVGAQPNWRTPQACREVKALLAELSGAQKELAAAIRHSVCAGLGGFLRGFAGFALERFQEEGRLTFQDYLIECRDLLRRDREVRGYFQRRFRSILLDEFQDTDPLQVEIAFFLAEERPVASDWREVRLEPGKLFIVGDPKQSIYRFRRADIELYQEVRDRVARDGRVLSIRRNHRSVPALIEWVNSTFSVLIRKPAEGNYQPDYSPLLPHRPGIEGPVVEDLKPQVALESVPEARRHEAERVADLLVAIQASGTRWGDMALLFPRATGVEIHEEALRAREVPYHLDGGREFFRRFEVEGILNCLDALERPEDRIALVAALKSAVFGHCDEEIVELVAAGGQLSYLKELPPAAAGLSVAESLGFLSRLHSERHVLCMAGVVGRLVDSTGAAAAAALRRVGGLGASQNLKKLQGLARRFDEEEGAGAALGSFARWLKSMSETDSREAESPTFEEKDDVVRLLTIHKSKGLQFPVVVLVNLGKDEGARDAFIWNGEKLEVRLGGSRDDALETRGFRPAREKELVRQEAERIRLLYVAATRARDRLIVSRIVAPKAPGDLRHLEGHPAPEEARAAAAPPQAAEAGAAPGEEVEARIALWREEVHTRPERIRASYRPPTPRRPSEAHGVLPAPLSTGGDLGSEAASLFGSAVHRVLEWAPLDAGPEELGRLGALAAREAGLVGRGQEITLHVKRALSSGVASRARRSGLVRREMPLSVEIEGSPGPIQGKIDLLFEEEGGLTLVDFKTDRIEAAEVSSRAAYHREQLRLYRQAIEKVTGRKVREAVLVFTALGQEQRFTAEELA